MFNDYVLIRSLFNSRSFFFSMKKKKEQQVKLVLLNKSDN